MSSIATYTIAAMAKFDNLILAENGLILEYEKKRKRGIPFSELDKIYIKTYKLNPFLKLAFILFPFSLVFFSVQYLPFDILTLMAFLIFIPIFLKVNNYKWYRLKIVLKDGTFFTKKVSVDGKTENITTINKVKKEWFNYNTNTMASV